MILTFTENLPAADRYLLLPIPYRTGGFKLKFRNAFRFPAKNFELPLGYFFQMPMSCVGLIQLLTLDAKLERSLVIGPGEKIESLFFRAKGDAKSFSQGEDLANIIVMSTTQISLAVEGLSGD